MFWSLWQQAVEVTHYNNTHKINQVSPSVFFCNHRFLLLPLSYCMSGLLKVVFIFKLGAIKDFIYSYRYLKAELFFIIINHFEQIT